MLLNGLDSKVIGWTPDVGHIINGGMDPLYPASLVEPYVFHLRRRGVEVQYTQEPEAGHNTSWWPEVKDTY